MIYWVSLLFVVSFKSAFSASLDKDPLFILKREKLIGYFPMDRDEFENYALPNDETGENGILNTGSEHTSLAYKGEAARYFDGKSFAKLPLSIESKDLPAITIGGWMRPTAREDVTSQLR